MTEFRTLQFPNTPHGQTLKVRALQDHTAQGWRVVSESIVPGKFRGKDACCLFLICAPCAFLAGYTDDTIMVTLERTSQGLNQANYDQAKWNALTQYDPDIAAVANRIRPLGSKWMDELASAYLVLNDKNYLPEIEARIADRIRLEHERIAAEKKLQEDRLAAEREERERMLQAKKEQRHRLYDVFWGSSDRRVRTAIVGAISLSVILIAILYWLSATSG